MSFNWTDVYPGHRVLTLVLPAREARKLLEEAALDGRLIAPDTVRGLPDGGGQMPFEPVSKASGEPVERPIVQRCDRAGRDPGPVSAPVVPVARPRPRPVGPMQGGESPLTIKTIDPALRAMIDEAVAAGKVTRCPPRTYALDASDPSGRAWKRTGPVGKTEKVAAARARKRATAEPG